MSNASFLYDNVSGKATLTVSGEEIGFESNKLVDLLPGTFFKSDSASGTITFDFGDSQVIKGISIINHNMTSSDTVFKFETSDDNFTTTEESIDLSIVSRYISKRVSTNYVDNAFQRNDTIYIGTFTRKQYRIRFEKSLTGDQFCQIGQIYLGGAYYELEKNFVYGSAQGNQAFYNEITSKDGRAKKYFLNSKKYFDLPFKQITGAQKDILENNIQVNETVIFSDGQSTYHYFSNVSNTVQPINTFNDNWDCSYYVTEVI